MNEFRCLSIRQPYAWAILSGIKKTENRTWSTDYRGMVVIHASASLQDLNAFRKESGCEYFSPEHMPLGAIVGFAELLDVGPYGPQHEADPFAFGTYCWDLTNPRALVTPIPLKGKLNLFKIDDVTAAQLRTAPTIELNQLSIDASPDSSRAANAMYGEPDPFGAYLNMIEHFCL